MIAGHATSISLEPVFWDALRAAAAAEGLPLNALVARIDAERIAAPDPPNLASAIRVWLFERHSPSRKRERVRGGRRYLKATARVAPHSHPSIPSASGREGLTRQQHSRLGGDLGEHRRGRDRGGPRALDGLAELLDARSLLDHPFVDGGLGIHALTAAEELETQLLEIAGQACGQQPFPLVARLEMVGGILRPVETERLAQPV